MSSTTRRATAPGRVTVLGEHTDYNEGSSLGVATRERTSVTATPGLRGRVVVRSTACGDASCRLSAPLGPGFIVLAAVLAARAGLDGVTLDVVSDLPVGAGVSSSAAYAVAVALALGLDDEPVGLARVCQDAERRAGSDVGLLDQLVILSARPREVVHLDFRGPAIAWVPLPPEIGLTVLDTGERRLLAGSAYAARRAECEAAAQVIGPLGTATRADLDRLSDPVQRARARHVVAEVERVAAGREALVARDLEMLGSLLDEAHRSLRDDFEVSTPRVEAVREEVRSLPGVVGARLCGAGFGGSLVVAHDPAVEVRLRDRWSSRLDGGERAVSSTS